MNDNKNWVDNFIGGILLIYMFGVFFTWIAFSSLETPNLQKIMNPADAFLKAVVWPYSVTEWNTKN